MYRFWRCRLALGSWGQSLRSRERSRVGACFSREGSAVVWQALGWGFCCGVVQNSDVPNRQWV
eukprot:1554260-Prymnesium_polylepis.1